MTKLTFAPGDVRRVVQHMAAATEWSQSPFEKEERGAKPRPQLLFVHDDGVYVMSNGKPRDIVSEDRTFCAYATGFDPDKDGNVWGRARDAVGGGDFVEWLDLSAEQIALVLSDDFAGMMIDVSADSLEVICRSRIDNPRDPPSISKFCTRTKSRVFDELVKKLRRLPNNHPDRSRLIWMILDLRGEIERRPDDDARSFAADKQSRCQDQRLNRPLAARRS